jgi:MoxR-like ATPase
LAYQQEDCHNSTGKATGVTENLSNTLPPLGGDRILFLDELTSAPQMTQVGCHQLVLDRKLGEYRLPDSWVVIDPDATSHVNA